MTRTAKLLTARLECLAVAAERPGRHDDLQSAVRLASLATRNAVELELLSEAEAQEIWTDSARRHPSLALFVSRN